MLVHIKEIVKKAKSGGYAVGAFNIHNIETIFGVVQAAALAKSPVIIQVSEGTIKYMGVAPIVSLVKYASKEFAPKIPFALHLDHGRDIKCINECIKNGFSSVHIDASDLPLNENIKLTKKVAAFAHAKNIWVQAEIGSIVGGHGDVGGKIEGVQIADPKEVVELIKKTKIDTIAAAIGTAHGAYDNEDIRFDVLKKIITNIKIPFVLHGGSGVDDKKIRKAIKGGVNIINIGTDVKVAFSRTLIETCLNNKNETDPRKLLKPTIKAVGDVVYKKIKLFGSAGKA